MTVTPPPPAGRHRLRQKIHLLTLLILGVLSISPQACAATNSTSATPPQVILQSSSKTIQAWRQTLMAQPGNAGCTTAHYPDTGWKAVPCVQAKPMTRPPRLIKTGNTSLGIHPAITGNFNDYMALSSTGTTTASASIAEIDNLSSETDSQFGQGNYSLQMNTNGFVPPARLCSNCTGVVQFIYNQHTAQIYVQYWLTGSGTQTSCPGGWTFANPSCYQNGIACNASPGVNATTVPSEAVADVPQLVLYGGAVGGGNDFVALAAGNYLYKQSACDSLLNLSGSGNWTATEFNIFGSQSSSAANFNTGILMTVNISLTDTSADFPSCTTVQQSGGGNSTVETTNMNLGACKPTRTGISFVEGVPPQTASVSPDIGSEDGGTRVVITGTASNGQPTGGFSSNMQALFGTPFGGAYAGAVCANNACTVYAPAYSGHVYAMVENLTSEGAPGVLSNPNLLFDYVAVPEGLLAPHTGPNAGGTAVALTGKNFNLSPGGTVITFNFASGPLKAANIACGPSTSTVPGYSQSCTFTAPPLPDPPGSGATIVPVTATANSFTGPVGSYTYTSPAPPPPSCAECRAQGERCIIKNGEPICACQKSSPTGACE